MGHLLRTGLQDTPLDHATDLLFPKRVQRFLDRPVYTSDLFHLNYWTGVHVLMGMLWALIPGSSLLGLLVAHSLFELAQLVLGQYFVKFPLTLREGVDVLVDTLASVVGYGLIKH